MTMLLHHDSGSGKPLTISDSSVAPSRRNAPEAANAGQSPSGSGDVAGTSGAGAVAAGTTSAAATTTTGSGSTATSQASTAAGNHRGTTPPTTQPPASKPAVAPTGPTAATPGTYKYRQAGSLPGTPAEGTLVVAPVSGSGTQVWTRKVGGTVPASASVMLFDTTGSYLVSPGGQVGGAPAACTFNLPVPWPPWPTTPGLSYSAQATCSGPVSSYNATGRVTGSATLSLDGHQINTSIVVNTFVLKGSYAGSPLTMTLAETDYYAPNLRVPVVTRTHVVGSAIGLPVSTDRTDTLESATPS
jgi:hypothetical protein